MNVIVKAQSADTAWRTLPLYEVRQFEAEQAYQDGLRDFLRLDLHPREAAHYAALLAISRAINLLPYDRQNDVFERLRDIPGFLGTGGLENFVRDKSLISLGRASLADDPLRRQEYLIGQVSGFSALAHKCRLAATLAHVPLRPEFKLQGFHPFIDAIVFGVGEWPLRATAAAVRDVPSTPTPASSESAPGLPAPKVGSAKPIAALIEDFCATAKGSQAKRLRSAATLFVKAAGLRSSDEITALASVAIGSADTFHELSRAVGRAWGTVADRYKDATGAEILTAASADPQPKWARTPMAMDGAKLRVQHAQAFLHYARGQGVTVPPIDWRAVEAQVGLSEVRQ